MTYLKSRIVFTAVALIPGFSPLGAKDATVKTSEGVSVTYALNGTEKIARVKGFAETLEKTITIPSKIKIDGVSYTVTKIGAGAFKDSSFDTVNLPNTITLIDKEAFSDSWVRKCNIPTQVEAIKSNAFSYTLLESAVIPGTCTEIGDHAFYNTRLSKLVFEDGFRDLTIVSDAFAGNWLTELSIPYRVSSIGDGAFHSTKIVSLDWQSRCTAVPARCFYSCQQLRSVRLWLGVTSIGESAFSFTPALTDIEIQNSMRTIGRFAFWNSGLTSVSIPEGVTSLGESAFESCENMRSVSLPSTLSTIGQTCFQGCEAIRTVICDALVPPVCGNSAFANVVYDNAVLTVPESVWRVYSTSDTWHQFNYSGYSGVEEVGADQSDTSVTEYFDLYGRRVDAPQAGRVCIGRRNGRTTKIIIK